MVVNSEQMPNSEGPTTEKEPVLWTLMDILTLLALHKGLILQISLGMALLASVCVFLLPNTYTAQVIILPPSQAPGTSALLGELGSSAGLSSLAASSLGINIKSSAQLYLSLFHTQAVENAVISRFELKSRYKEKILSNARKDLEAHMSVELGAKDGLIRLSITDKDPFFSASLANGYVEEFHKLFSNLAVTEAAERRQFYEAQLRQAKENLANAEVDFKNTEQTTGALQIDSQAKALIQEDAALRAQIAAKEVQLKGMHSYATEQNPSVQLAERELTALRTQLHSLTGSENSTGSDIVIPKARIPEAGMAYVRKLRDVKYYETIYESIARQFEIAKLDEARQGATIQVVDPALPPDKKSGPKRLFIVLGFFLASLLLASLYVFLKENLSTFLAIPSQRERLQRLRESLLGKR